MTNAEAIRIINQYDCNFYWTDGEKIPTEDLIDAFELAVKALDAQTPRVLTPDELMAHWKVPPKERPPIWEEWRIDKGKGGWRLYGRATGGYGTLWRCWSAKPTDEQREATPWKQEGGRR